MRGNGAAMADPARGSPTTELQVELAEAKVRLSFLEREYHLLKGEATHLRNVSQQMWYQVQLLRDGHTQIHGSREAAEAREKLRADITKYVGGVLILLLASMLKIPEGVLGTTLRAVFGK